MDELDELDRQDIRVWLDLVSSIRTIDDQAANEIMMVLELDRFAETGALSVTTDDDGEPTVHCGRMVASAIYVIQRLCVRISEATNVEQSEVIAALRDELDQD